MLLRTIRIVALLAVATVTAAWTELPMTEENTLIRISGFEAEGRELWRDRNGGWNHTVEYLWWTADEAGHTGQAAFWYSPEDAGRWSGKFNQKRRFLTDFGWLEDRDAGKSGLSQGPTFATVVGDIETTTFTARTEEGGEDLSECMGFRHWWKRYRDGYRKVLDVYACGLDGKQMTEDQFRGILAGLSITDEFDALFEH